LQFSDTHPTRVHLMILRNMKLDRDGDAAAMVCRRPGRVLSGPVVSSSGSPTV